MKKLLLLLMLIPSISFSQKIDSTISEGKFGGIEGEYFKSTENGTTRYRVSCSFQNAKYEYIVDIGLIFITKRVVLDSLISDLEGILNYVGTETEVSYDRKSYALIHYDFAPQIIYVQDADGAYTRLSKKQAEKWLEWLKTINFPG